MALVWDIKERRAQRRKARERKRALGREAKSQRRRVVLKATATIVTLLLLLALALVVGDSDYHATVIGWGPFVAALCALALAYAYVRLLEAHLSYSEEINRADCKRGACVPFKVKFKNKGPLLFFKIEVEFFISDLFGNVAHSAKTTLALGPFESYELALDAQFDHIGTYEAGVRRVVVSDFLGLFERELAPRAKQRVEVTPRIQNLERVSFDDAATAETSKTAKSVLADSLDYSQVREYEPGDPLKTIHWKLSAHSAGYLTRLYEVYREPGVAIILDFHGKGEDAGTLMGMFDAVVESGLSIATFTRAQGIDTELHFQDRFGEERTVFDWGADALPKLVSDMPAMSNADEAAGAAVGIVQAQIANRHGQSTLVVCSAGMDSVLISALVDAKAQRRAPLLVAVVPPELDGRALDAYCKPLAALDAANIPYVVIARSEDLAVVLR